MLQTFHKINLFIKRLLKFYGMFHKKYTECTNKKFMTDIQLV